MKSLMLRHPWKGGKLRSMCSVGSWSPVGDWSPLVLPNTPGTFQRWLVSTIHV